MFTFNQIFKKSITTIKYLIYLILFPGKLNRKHLEQILLKLKDENLIDKSPLELFKVLWEKYTNTSEESSCFLSVGGNSVTAMIIANRMSELCEGLPTTVLTEMLNNASLLKCCDLITAKVRNEQEKKIFVKRGTSNPDKPAAKKSKAFSQDTILFSQMKGCGLPKKLILNYGYKLELTVKWLHNLGKCVDSSPTCIEYKRLVFFT